jgi:hypothetical protein
VWDSLNALLARLIPKSLGKRGRRVAVDVVALPYHGTVEKAHHHEVCCSKATRGTMHFFPLLLPLPKKATSPLTWRWSGTTRGAKGDVTSERHC